MDREIVKRISIPRVAAHAIETGSARPVSAWTRRLSEAEHTEFQCLVQPCCIGTKERWNIEILRQPLPSIEECLSILGKQKYFTLLDLVSGYWQVPITEEDKEKTAFITRNGLFEWNVLPFGLANAPSTFQRMMDVVLTGLLWEECLVYIDDVLVFGDTLDQHNQRLARVLARLEEAGLKVRLGHVISAAGIHTNPGLVAAVRNFPVPTTPTEVQSFIGLVGFSRRFIPNFASIARPLIDLSRPPLTCSKQR